MVLNKKNILKMKIKNEIFVTRHLRSRTSKFKRDYDSDDISQA